MRAAGRLCGWNTRSAATSATSAMNGTARFVIRMVFSILRQRGSADAARGAADARQIALPTSSATSSAPLPSIATPTGRP